MFEQKIKQAHCLAFSVGVPAAVLSWRLWEKGQCNKLSLRQAKSTKSFKLKSHFIAEFQANVLQFCSLFGRGCLNFKQLQIWLSLCNYFCVTRQSFDRRIMQARKERSHDKITTNDSYFSGDEYQPSNRGKSRNSCKCTN